MVIFLSTLVYLKGEKYRLYFSKVLSVSVRHTRHAIQGCVIHYCKLLHIVLKEDFFLVNRIFHTPILKLFNRIWIPTIE